MGKKVHFDCGSLELVAMSSFAQCSFPNTQCRQTSFVTFLEYFDWVAAHGVMQNPYKAAKLLCIGWQCLHALYPRAFWFSHDRSYAGWL